MEDLKATVTTATAPIVVAPTSEKLTALQAERKAERAKLATLEDGPDYDKQFDVCVKLDAAIKTEVAAIKTEQRNAEIAEMRNKRVQLYTDAIEAYDAHLAVHNDKKASIEDKNAAYAAYKAKAEIVTNELLSKVGGAVKPVTTATGEAKQSTGGQAEIIELFLAGKTQPEIIEAGHKRSTVWHTINNYKIANGLK